MRVFQRQDDVVIEGISHFDIDQTFSCGQCFRFDRQEDGGYIGVAYNRVLSIRQEGDTVTLAHTNLAEYHQVWERYLDIGRDYSTVIKRLDQDEHIRAATTFGSGIRILAQEPFECLVSFLLSQNNSIPNIRRVVERICRTYGTQLAQGYFAFPTPQQLGRADEEALANLRCGYRAGYIAQAVASVLDGSFDLAIGHLPTEELRQRLMSLKGVGRKVADCIALFGYQKIDVFPTDVWVKKAMRELYQVEGSEIDSFSSQYFGKYRGLAQQYLFYHMRCGY